MRDRELGLDRPITRRDFVYGSAVIVGGAMAGCRPSDGDAGAQAAAAQDYDFALGDAWYGPGGVGDYAASHGNTPGVLRAAHQIREGLFDAPPNNAIDSGEEYDLVVVGGGFSGLSAAHHFRRLNPGGRALLLDNHPMFGGEAKRNEFVVNGVRISGPQGSNGTNVLPNTGDPDDYFSSLGIPRDLRYVEPQGSAAGMRIPMDHYGFMHWHQDRFDVGHFFRGARQEWVKDLWGSGLSSSPWSADVQAAWQRARAVDSAELPNVEGELGPWLDSMTMQQYYERVLGLPPEIPRYLNPLMASIIGLGCDVLSAWWGYYFRIPGFRADTSPPDYYYDAFPGGNAGIARHFLKNLVPDGIEGSGEFEDVIYGNVAFDRLDRVDNPVRVRLGSTVVRVEHEGPEGPQQKVLVTYTNGGQVYQVRARAVMMGSGGWVNRHVLKDLPTGHRSAYEELGHAPVLVANVALTNWRFLERLGVAGAMWEGGFGFSANISRPMIVGGDAPPLHPDRPTVMTFYAPIIKPGLPRREQGIAARAELLSKSFADYEREIREQMVAMFGSSGFDPTNDIAGIVLNRWGHAFASPGPGFMFGRGGAPAPADVLREPIGRIAIGHSEQRGHQYWTGAAGEGRRAVETLLDLHF
jgi:spermidine dehydrogenase